LPAHMLPARYVTLPAMPRLANGKVDRLALAHEAARAAAEGQQMRTAVPPRDAVEGVLVGCMAELLGGRSVGAEDDFFELGGHSLLVIKLVARIRKLLKVEIAPSVVFENPSVAALALALRQHATDLAAMERLAEAQQQLARLSPEQREALLARASR
jgi:acyl carrier protein